MFHYYHPLYKVVQDAAMYDMLANYYKYLDPQRHIYYYQLHLMCMQQLCQMQTGMVRTTYETPVEVRQQTAKVRVLHVSPDAPRVDIYVSGKKTFNNMKYYQISPYIDVPVGSHKIEIYIAGQKTNPLLSQNIDIQAGNNYTVAAAGYVNDLSLVTTKDIKTTPRDKANVRVWHLSPNAPAVDIAIPKGETLFRNVAFSEVANYLELPPGRMTLELRKAGTNEILLTIRDTNIKAHEAYTIAAIGLSNGKPRFEVLILKP